MTMSMDVANQNDTDAFADMIRSALPELIRTGTAGEVEQNEDRELMAWTANREAAFEIFLSNGASYQFTLRQTSAAIAECRQCNAPFHDDELDGHGRCPHCAEDGQTRTEAR